MEGRNLCGTGGRKTGSFFGSPLRGWPPGTGGVLLEGLAAAAEGEGEEAEG
jgi:hypothetical protein